jgi:hypothetical protein
LRCYYEFFLGYFAEKEENVENKHTRLIGDRNNQQQVMACFEIWKLQEVG